MENPRIERRAAPVEATDDEKMVVEGYAAVFDSPTVLFRDGETEYKEVIDRSAFDEADMSDVVMRYNHNDDCMILARTLNGTLSLSVDDKGLKIRAELAPTSQGKDLYTLIKRGDVAKMSFAFTTRRDAYDANTRTRHIEQIDRLVDVSAVDMPAYDDTSLAVAKRSIKMAQQEREHKRRRLALKLELMKGA